MKRLIIIAVMLGVVGLVGYVQAGDLPKLDDGQVIMKWDDFEKILKELLKPPPKEPEPEPEKPPVPPVQFSLHSASFDLTIGDGFAEVEADYSVNVLVEKQWVEVPLGQSYGGVHEVKVDGKPALINDRGGYIVVLFLGKGSHHLEVNHTVSAPQNPGPNSFYIPVASVPGAVIKLTAPAELTEISIQGAVVTKSDKNNKVSVINAVAGATQGLSVNYTVPVSAELAAEAEKLPSKLYSSVEMLVSIADEVTSANANFAYDIKHSPMSRFSIAVPAGFDVVNVTGQGISGWKTEDGKLTVNANYEIQGPYSLQVQLESKREKASGTVVIPEPVTIDAERESGYIAVETRSSLELQEDKLDGLLPIDSTELPASLRGRSKYPVLYSFRFGRHPYNGSISVTRHEEVDVLNAAIDNVNLVTLFTEDGKSVTRMIYEIRNNKRQYIKINLPDKAEVWSAFLDDEPMKPSMNKTGQLLLPLKKSGADGKKISFTVEIIYYAPVAEMNNWGRQSITFPKTDIPASEMLVSLYLPPKYKYWKFEGDLEETYPDYITTMVTETAPASTIEDGAKKEMAGEKKQKKNYYSQRAMERQEALEQEVADEIRMNAQGFVGGDRGDYDSLQDDKTAQRKPRSRGMLPVKFNVPLRGKVKRLSKLLVMDESPELTFKYRKIWEPLSPVKKGKYGKIAILLAGGIVFIYVVRIIRRRRRAGKNNQE